MISRAQYFGVSGIITCSNSSNLQNELISISKLIQSVEELVKSWSKKLKILFVVVKYDSENIPNYKRFFRMTKK